MKGFSFSRFGFKNVSEERWMWITRWVKCVKLKEPVLWPCTRMLVQMEGHYGCKALDGNTSLGLCKFCKWLEFELCEHPSTTLQCVLEGEMSCVLCLILEWTETKSVALVLLSKVCFILYYTYLYKCHEGQTVCDSTLDFLLGLNLGLLTLKICFTALNLYQSPTSQLQKWETKLVSAAVSFFSARDSVTSYCLHVVRGLDWNLI